MSTETKKTRLQTRLEELRESAAFTHGLDPSEYIDLDVQALETLIRKRERKPPVIDEEDDDDFDG